MSAVTGARLGCPSTAPAEPADSADPRVPADSTEPSEPAEPIENADPAEPIDPADRNDPIDPIDRNEPLEAMHSIESCDHSDHLESDTRRSYGGFEHAAVTAWRAMSAAGMELGVHLPLMEFGDEGQSWSRLDAAAGAARECGFAAISANDHYVFSTAWLDGPSALAAAAPRSGGLELATTVANVVLRGPVPLAKALTAVDALSDGGVVAGVGPGSSERDYDAVGIPFPERWPRFEEATAMLRALLRGAAPPSDPRFYAWPSEPLMPPPTRAEGIPVWIGSWGSDAGLRRVARLADGWLASAYNTTPSAFAAARRRLLAALEARGRKPDRFPSALATMWTWVTEDPSEADTMLERVLAPLLRRQPEDLRPHLCIGSPAHCAELLSRYSEAGCGRVYLWPLGDERRQLELVAAEVVSRM